MTASVAAACFNGLALPLMIVVYGELTDAFVAYDLYNKRICAQEPGCCHDGGGYVRRFPLKLFTFIYI